MKNKKTDKIGKFTRAGSRKKKKKKRRWQMPDRIRRERRRAGDVGHFKSHRAFRSAKSSPISYSARKRQTEEKARRRRWRATLPLPAGPKESKYWSHQGYIYSIFFCDMDIEVGKHGEREPKSNTHKNGNFRLQHELHKGGGGNNLPAPLHPKVGIMHAEWGSREN